MPTPVSVLAAWEAAATPAQLAAQLPHQPAVLACLTELAAFSRLDINVDLEDARAVLRGAGAVRAATATASGPGRVADALRQLRAALSAPPALARHALLTVLSAPAALLEMDELNELTETIYTWLGDDGELVFGHGEQPAASPAKLRVWLLLGYGSARVQEQLAHVGQEKAAPTGGSKRQQYAVEVRLLGQSKQL